MRVILLTHGIAMLFISSFFVYIGGSGVGGSTDDALRRLSRVKVYFADNVDKAAVESEMFLGEIDVAAEALVQNITSHSVAMGFMYVLTLISAAGSLVLAYRARPPNGKAIAKT
jgi:hypothetical protein